MLIRGTSLYVVIYMSYKLLKTFHFYGQSCTYKLAFINVMINATLTFKTEFLTMFRMCLQRYCNCYQFIGESRPPPSSSRAGPILEHRHFHGSLPLFAILSSSLCHLQTDSECTQILMVHVHDFLPGRRS